EAGRDKGRRRHGARPLAVPLWLEHGQQQRPRQLSPARDPDRWRQRAAQGWQEPDAARAHAAGQPASHHPREAGHRAGKIRHQHGAHRGSLSMYITDRRKFLRSGMAGVVGLAAVPVLGSLAGCQSAPARSRIALQTQPLTERVRVISGAPGNVVVLEAADGLVLVDSGSPEAAGALQAELDGKVRTLINTHYHSDQTGGNALF